MNEPPSRQERQGKTCCFAGLPQNKNSLLGVLYALAVFSLFSQMEDRGHPAT
jgi:hypothetical protein